VSCACKFLVKEKALSIYKNLSQDDDDYAKPLNVSTDWFSKFTKRYNLCNIKVKGEAAAAEKFFIALYTQCI
jgi:hypothetical protein